MANSPSWKEFLLDSRSTTFGSFRRRWWGFWSFKWIHYLGVEVEIRLPSAPPLQKTIFLGNTSVLGIRALNNVGTWVTYWKWWLYAGGSSPDRSCSILRLFSSTCRLRLLSALLPLSPLDLLGARNPTNCRQSHICRIFTLIRYWPPLSSRHTIANSSRVYIHTCLCACLCVWNFDATWYKSKERDISAAARWFMEWQKLYRRNLRGEELSSPLDLSS